MSQTPRCEKSQNCVLFCQGIRVFLTLKFRGNILSKSIGFSCAERFDMYTGRARLIRRRLIRSST